MIARVERAVSVDLIDIGDRLRPADEAYVEVLAASMAASGQIEDIEIRPNAKVAGRFLLTAGLHRLLAVRALGQPMINAVMVDRSEVEARLVEIDENLMRRELGPLDRAVFLAARKKAWDEIYGAPVHGGDRKSLKRKGENQTDKMSVRTFTTEAAERTGLTDRSIRRSIALIQNLKPAQIARLRTTYLATNATDLAAFAELSPAEQAKAEAALAAGKIKRLADLRPRDQLPADEAQFKALVDKWTRASLKARKRFLAHVGADFTGKRAPELSVVSSNDEDAA